MAVKDAVKVLYPKQNKLPNATNSRTRFSQLLLEHGEKAIQDWEVLARSSPAVEDTTPSAGDLSGNDPTASNTEIEWLQSPDKAKISRNQYVRKKRALSITNKDVYPSANMSKIAGRLHLCSGSVVFEPSEANRGIVRCSFHRMDGPPEAPGESGFEGLSVEFICKRHIVIHNTVAPFQTVHAKCKFQFTFLHSSPSNFVETSQKLFAIFGNNNRRHHHASSPEITKFLPTPTFDRGNFLDVREQAITPQLKCAIVSPLQSKPGVLVVTAERIYWQPISGVFRHWMQRSVVATARRYNGLRDAGLEIYWSDETSTLFAFERRHDREQALHALSPVQCLTDREFLIKIIKAWHTSEISNFEYLLALNTIAGRSFHDLSRYPVFPWVIADYESEKLDLTNPKTFRDLSLPVGALNQSRLDYFVTRLKSMRDTSMDEAFLYGTHYSAPGYVLYFLVRSMPEHMLCLQNGKFDAPDRMFHSVGQCFKCAMTNHADVKELIPEFYNESLNFDFLINVKGLQLGATQNGDRVNDVVLPTWARSPRDFIKKNRKALESEYCTRMLPKWIDLIFGCKSRGNGAMEANNVFHPNAYLGPTDIAGMQTEEERFTAELQATEFGIVPDKLFLSDHPQKAAAFTEEFIAEEVGRASSKDESGREAWELLDDPSKEATLRVLEPKNDNPGVIETTWDSAKSLKTIVDSSASHVDRYPLQGSGEGITHTGSFALGSRPSQEKDLAHTPSEDDISSLVQNAGETSTEWNMEVLAKKTVHGDAISGCALFVDRSQQDLTLLVTTSLDGGLTVHTVSLSEPSETIQGQQQQKSGFSSTFSQFSYKSILNRHLSQPTAPSRLSEYRVHSSRDPLASLVLAEDGSGGCVAFAGGHDDVVLAYGIKSACAVASVYSHRDAVTGLDIVSRTAMDSECALWLENSTHIMVSGSWDATVKVWSASVASGETVAINREPLAELFDASASIVCVSAIAVQSTGIMIAAGCQDGSFCVWNLHNDGVQVQIHDEPAKRGSGPCSVAKWCLVGDTVHLYTAYSTGKLVSYILADNSIRRESAVSVGVAISAMQYYRGYLLLGCADGGLRLVPLKGSTTFEGKPTLWKAIHNKKTAPGISSISIVDGDVKTICATGAEDGSVLLFDLTRLPHQT